MGLWANGGGTPEGRGGAGGAGGAAGRGGVGGAAGRGGVGGGGALAGRAFSAAGFSHVVSLVAALT